MAKIRWEPVAIKTMAGIFGVRAFVEEIERALPDAETKALDYLNQRARKEKWDDGEYAVEQAEGKSKFRHWLPRLAAYSAITLIHSVVEAQLSATATRLRELRGYPLTVNDLKGDAVERAKTYLTKVAGIQVGSDAGWQVLQDLAELRNIIVHRCGRQGTDPKQQQTVRQLTERHPDGISISGLWEDPDAEVKVSLAMCKRFIDETEGFFERLFAAADWPKGAVIDSTGKEQLA